MILCCGLVTSQIWFYLVISAKMIIVDMPWIMNGESCSYSKYLLVPLRNQSLWLNRSLDFVVGTPLFFCFFQLHGRLWRHGWVQKPSASSSLHPKTRSRRLLTLSTSLFTWVEWYIPAVINSLTMAVTLSIDLPGCIHFHLTISSDEFPFSNVNILQVLHLFLRSLFMRKCA